MGEDNSQNQAALGLPASSSGVVSSLVLLYLEDNLDDQVLFRLACERSGVPLECVAVDAAPKAIAHMEQLLQQGASEALKQPDLALLDLEMPGLGGLAVLRYLRGSAAWQSLPAIIFTGGSNRQQLDEAYRLGANSCLRKPLRFDQTVAVARAIHLAWTVAWRPQLPAVSR
ncbi:MAG TPA: response regulator [Bacillota bacterium]|nr:response regulator [Bacillota bacterium]